MKDRLAELKAMSKKGSVRKSPSLVGDNLIRETCPAKAELLKAFSREVEAMSTDLDMLEAGVTEVRGTHGALIRSPNANDVQLKRKLDAQMDSVRTMATDIKKSLKSLVSTTVDEAKTMDSSAAYVRIRETHSFLLKKRFVDIMDAHNGDQVTFREANKDKIRRQFDIMGQSVTEDDLNDMLESGNVSVFTRGITDQQKLVAVQDRYDHILALEKSIGEMKALMEDLAQFVSAQGEKIDSIEGHVSKGKEYVEKSVIKIDRAVVLKNEYRKKKIFCWVTLIIIAIVVIIVLGVTLTQTSSSGNVSSGEIITIQSTTTNSPPGRG